MPSMAGCLYTKDKLPISNTMGGRWLGPCSSVEQISIRDDGPTVIELGKGAGTLHVSAEQIRSFHVA